MIVLRKTDGSKIEIKEPGTFVELVNDMDGTVMMVFIQLQPGAILHITPGTADSARYEQMFAKHGVKFAENAIARG